MLSRLELSTDYLRIPESPITGSLTLSFTHPAKHIVRIIEQYLAIIIILNEPQFYLIVMELPFPVLAFTLFFMFPFFSLAVLSFFAMTVF